MRTIRNLSKLNGRVYIYLANAEIGHRFMQQAESEGFTFKDGEKPTERGYEEIVAINHDGTRANCLWFRCKASWRRTSDTDRF